MNDYIIAYSDHRETKRVFALPCGVEIDVWRCNGQYRVSIWTYDNNDICQHIGGSGIYYQDRHAAFLSARASLER